jgi:hypothetical protein
VPTLRKLKLGGLVLILALTVVMGVLAGGLVARRVLAVDPAELHA